MVANSQWSRNLLYFKRSGNRKGCAQILPAFARRTPADFQAEFPRFEGQFAVVIIKGHHFWRYCECHRTTLTRSKKNSFESYEMMKWDQCRGLQITQIELNNLSSIPSATVMQSHAEGE